MISQGHYALLQQMRTDAEWLERKRQCKRRSLESRRKQKVSEIEAAQREIDSIDSQIAQIELKGQAA